MSLFSSPAFRIFSSENSESIIQRKPGANTLQTRKPFVDKTVNCNTPDVNKKQKSNLTIKEPVKTASPAVKTPSLEIPPEDYFSYKEIEDNYEEQYTHSKRLEYQNVYSIVKNYVDNNTPPPSPISVNIPFEVPMLNDSLETSFSSNNSDDDNMFFKMPKVNDFTLKPDDEIDVPVFNVDDF